MKKVLEGLDGSGRFKVQEGSRRLKKIKEGLGSLKGSIKIKKAQEGSGRSRKVQKCPGRLNKVSKKRLKKAQEGSRRLKMAQYGSKVVGEFSENALKSLFVIVFICTILQEDKVSLIMTSSSGDDVDCTMCNAVSVNWREPIRKLMVEGILASYYLSF